MRFTAALCAVSLSICGCALTHERSAPIPAAVDASIVVDDAHVPDVDAGEPTSCTLRWSTLPWCPADAAASLGQRCGNEGQQCGTACCQPGPAIACVGGVWVSAPAPECRGVDCVAPTVCGAGSCAPGAVCLSTSNEIRQPERCVVAPFATTSCSDIPTEWLTSDPRSCSSCRCSGVPSEIVVSLECDCCDR